MTDYNSREYREEDLSEIVPEFNDPNPRVRALKIMLDEFEYPSRDLRLAAQALQCRRAVEEVLAWLRAEVEKEIRLETLFDDLHSDND
jgi:hypothetical protein